MVAIIVWSKYWWTTDIHTRDILSSDYYGGIKQSGQWPTLFSFLLVLEKVDTLSLRM